jgi:hypothetical protein
MEINFNSRRESIRTSEDFHASLNSAKNARKNSASTQGTMSKNPRMSAVQDSMPQKMHIPNSREMKADNPLNPDKSFGSIIAQATYGSNAKYAASNDGKLDEIIPNFVSKHVRRMCHAAQLQEQQSSKRVSEKDLMIPTLTPSAKEAFAAVVMVDVSGYSKLTATLAERGAVGAELLSKTMKGYFDQV